MKNLYIIGNGFDLAHGLKTSYRHFRDYLIQMEKKECEEAGEVSISENHNLLSDGKITECFDNIAIPIMEKSLIGTANLLSSGKFSSETSLQQKLDELKKFYDDADKIVQWIKHGTERNYTRKQDESKAIKRFISMLEPETHMVTHVTNLNNISAFLRAIESDFPSGLVATIQSGLGEDAIPFWLILRLFIKMIDAVEGENWENLETSMGTYNFDYIFGLFKNLDQDELIHDVCIEHFFITLYYSIFELFSSWVAFVELAFEMQIFDEDIFKILRPHARKTQNGIELSLTMNKPYLINKENQLHSQNQFTEHPKAKKLFCEILNKGSSNYFLIFNYTQTVERVYGVTENNICHIHGKSKGIENLNSQASEDLIFGHGMKSYETDITNIKATAYNISKKPVSQCMINNELFFNKLKDITDIYSYGFSFSDVDMPYIEKIFRDMSARGSVVWHFNDFKLEENRYVYEEKLRKIGFNGCFDKFHVI